MESLFHLNSGDIYIPSLYKSSVILTSKAPHSGENGILLRQLDCGPRGLGEALLCLLVLLQSI